MDAGDTYRKHACRRIGRGRVVAYRVRCTAADVPHHGFVLERLSYKNICFDSRVISYTRAGS